MINQFKIFVRLYGSKNSAGKIVLQAKNIFFRIQSSWKQIRFFSNSNAQQIKASALQQTRISSVDVGVSAF
ncbi:hypothetical protein T4B_1438 [Trichinella pseudospiralis]|uniref:Uncharacterized protein n=2 Tax=Trichinella pseudospiralis TaxID=6337 RepID=A0A0V1IE00_TRIPS|nr:hypothetical protein T4D_6732 [Trichinella pseudospiralis]KRZ20738.1 hypothetical protein T4B_1438 [Trichinella pseudospiralis]